MATKTQMHDVDFGQRSRLALTHPVTLGTVGVLLLNDLVFKSLWSNPWTTGKLSDLAWVVFASPLLVWLLSLVVRDSRRGQRTAFIVAYVGLPLLYAAYNTFAPVHDVIIWGLSLLSGAASGSPLDPTDSLVIPVGLAVALWVWRRGGREDHGYGKLRRNATVLMAGVAMMASVATSGFVGPTVGITNVWVSDAGTLLALGSLRDGHLYESYESADGGMTWKRSSGVEMERRTRVETPRGRFGISGSRIVIYGSDGKETSLHSLAYLHGHAHRWIQTVDKEYLIGPQFTVVPHAIAYHPPSGNVVVAMGVEGLVVGTPDGRWLRVGVLGYTPTDFSPAGKIGTLFSDSWTLSAIICLSLSAVAVALALTGLLETSWREDFHFMLALMIGALAVSIVGAAAAIATWLFATDVIWRVEVDTEYLTNFSEFMTALASIGFSCQAILMCGRRALRHWLASLTALAGSLACISLVLIIWVLSNFSVHFVQWSGMALTLLVMVALARHFWTSGSPDQSE